MQSVNANKRKNKRFETTTDRQCRLQTVGKQNNQPPFPERGDMSGALRSSFDSSWIALMLF